MTIKARYDGTCKKCTGKIYVGETIEWAQGKGARHLDCQQPHTGKAAEIRVTRFSSGAEIYRNSRGRCEDAPCCGCCS